MSTRGQGSCLTCVQGHSDLYFQTSAAKPLGPLKPKFHVELLWVLRLKVCSNNLGHVTKMAAMPIYGKTPLIIFSETRRLMTFKFSIQHQGLGPYKVCSNDDPGLTLNYFTARSTLLPSVSFVWEHAYM